MNKSDYWLSDEGIVELTSMVKSGMKNVDICSAIGISYSTLRNWRQKYTLIGEIFICKGHMDIKYIVSRPEGKRERIYQYYKGNQKVRYCRECKLFVEESNIISSGYCYACGSNRAKTYYRSKEGGEKVRATRKRYYKENKYKEYKTIYKRHTLLKNNIFNYSQEIWDETLLYFDNSCAYCGRDGKPLEKEHVIPVSKNGAFVKTNIVPSCRECNMNKYTQPFEEWFIKYKYYDIKRHKKINKWIGIKNNVQQLTLL